jgi:hypothetical protein
MVFVRYDPPSAFLPQPDGQTQAVRQLQNFSDDQISGLI